MGILVPAGHRALAPLRPTRGHTPPPGGTMGRNAPATASSRQGSRTQWVAELCLNRAFSRPRTVKGAGSDLAEREAHEHTQRRRKRYREQKPDKAKQVSERK